MREMSPIEKKYKPNDDNPYYENMQPLLNSHQEHEKTYKYNSIIELLLLILCCMSCYINRSFISAAYLLFFLILLNHIKAMSPIALKRKIRAYSTIITLSIIITCSKIVVILLIHFGKLSDKYESVYQKLGIHYLKTSFSIWGIAKTVLVDMSVCLFTFILIIFCSSQSKKPGLVQYVYKSALLSDKLWFVICTIITCTGACMSVLVVELIVCCALLGWILKWCYSRVELKNTKVLSSITLLLLLTENVLIFIPDIFNSVIVDSQKSKQIGQIIFAICGYISLILCKSNLAPAVQSEESSLLYASIVEVQPKLWIHIKEVLLNYICSPYFILILLRVCVLLWIVLYYNLLSIPLMIWLILSVHFSKRSAFYCAMQKVVTPYLTIYMVFLYICTLDLVKTKLKSLSGDYFFLVGFTSDSFSYSMPLLLLLMVSVICSAIYLRLHKKLSECYEANLALLNVRK